jgi:hypothetical protein
MARTAAATRLLGVLLALAVVALAAAGLATAGWYRAARLPLDPSRLGPESRQALLGALLAQSPGLYIPAHFEPRMGYVLRPDQDLEAWGTSFRSNALGFRAGAPEKRPETVRVLFAGDS